MVAFFNDQGIFFNTKFQVDKCDGVGGGEGGQGRMLSQGGVREFPIVNYNLSKCYTHGLNLLVRFFISLYHDKTNVDSKVCIHKK